MTIQPSAQAVPFVSPNPGLPFTADSAGNRGMLTGVASIALQNGRNFVVGMNRTLPCEAGMSSNVITLTMLASQPDVSKYVSYEAFAFVAPADSTDVLSAQVVTSTGTLDTLPVYLNSGGRAGNGHIKQSALYRLFYNDSLNNGAGGFTLDGRAEAILVSVSSLTDSSGGTASGTVGAVSGTGDDTAINNNFASLTAKVNAIIAAVNGV